MPPPPNPSQVFSWQGRALLSTGLALFAGSVGDNRLHRHYAVQFALCARGEVRLTNAQGKRYAGGLVGCAAGHEHRLEPTGQEVIMIYLEPTSTIGKAAQNMTDGISIFESAPQPDLAFALRRAMVEGDPKVAEGLLRTLFKCDEPVGDRQSGRRLAKLIGSADFQTVPPPLAQAARQASLSPSRFSHLFSSEMGITYSAFRKWRKLLAALGSVANGAALTTAAHDGGFADSAHFSRTFKDTFGLAPSQFLLQVRLSPEAKTP